MFSFVVYFAHFVVLVLPALPVIEHLPLPVSNSFKVIRNQPDKQFFDIFPIIAESVGVSEAKIEGKSKPARSLAVELAKQIEQQQDGCEYRQVPTGKLEDLIETFLQVNHLTTNSMTPDSFYSQWLDEISTEAITKLDFDDDPGDVTGYLLEMSAQAERTMTKQRDIVFRHLSERIMGKYQMRQIANAELQEAAPDLLAACDLVKKSAKGNKVAMAYAIGACLKAITRLPMTWDGQTCQREDKE